VVLLDHRQRLGDRIAVSGGGMCNFSNRQVSPEDFVTANPRFLHSPLSAFSTKDALQMLTTLGLGYEEREFGQLFCRQGGDALRSALIRACSLAGVVLVPSSPVERVERSAQGFTVVTPKTTYLCRWLVLACGGLSYAKLGATDLGFRLARQFGHTILPPTPGLVPLIFEELAQARWSTMAGISLPVRCTVNRRTFSGDLLFTHRGLSGPVILTVSNHWQRGVPLAIDWLPAFQPAQELETWRSQTPRATLRSRLTPTLPKRLLDLLLGESLTTKPCNQLSRSEMQLVAETLKKTVITPQRTDGYEKAEVTRGGVNTREIDGKTMQSRLVPGLCFIGELVDVTGNLGGYNLHWAWASGTVCGKNL
jgi:predicted Rossmann fold flavoprotein